MAHVSRARESADLSLRIVTVLPIRIVGDPVLHTPTEHVAVAPDGSIPEDVRKLIADMYETMEAANGVGLAANQVGVALRVFVYDCAEARGRARRRRQSARG